LIKSPYAQVSIQQEPDIMANPRQRRDQSQWQQLIDQQLRSGLSGAAFCREHDVAYASFMGWRKRLGDVEPPSSSPSFIELTAPVTTTQNAPATASAQGSCELCVELTLGPGIELRIRRQS
jgi:hypothetical protein